MKTWIVDFDDFEDKNTGFEFLMKLKEKEPAFKATLFCIPMGCKLPTIEKLNKFGWLEPAVHGWAHHPLECKNWSKAWALQVLEATRREVVHREVTPSLLPLEHHRKARAFRWILDWILLASMRVLQVMREHGLL